LLLHGSAPGEYERVIAARAGVDEAAGMKRFITFALWFLAGWTAGGFLAWSIGLPDIVGPLLGLAALAILLLAGRPGSVHHQATQS
jgi:hypothetical protein